MRPATHHVLFVVIHDRRGPLDRQADDGLAAQNDQTERALHLLRGPRLRLAGLLLRAYAPELLALGEDEVHVPVKGEHLPDERAAVVDRDFQPPVNQTEHLSALGFWRRLRGWISSVPMSDRACGLTMVGDVLGDGLWSSSMSSTRIERVERRQTGPNKLALPALVRSSTQRQASLIVPPLFFSVVTNTAFGVKETCIGCHHEMTPKDINNTILRVLTLDGTSCDQHPKPL